MEQISESSPRNFESPPEEFILTPDLLKVVPECEKGGEILNGKGQLVRLRNIEHREWFVPVRLVVPNPEQPREYFDEKKMEELYASIHSEGQKESAHLVPFIYKSDLNNARLFIIEGERRYKIINENPNHYIRALIDWAEDKDDIFENSFILNLKTPHNPVEDAKAYMKLIEISRRKRGLNQAGAIESLVKRMGVSKNQILNYLKLLDLDLEIQQMIMEDKLPSATAMHLIPIARMLREKGVNITAAMIARRIIDDPDKFADKAGPAAGRVTGGGVRRAARSLLLEVDDGERGVIDDVDALEARTLVAKFYAYLHQTNKITSDLLDKPFGKAFIGAFKNGRQPPEVVKKLVVEFLKNLQIVYEKIIKPAIAPPLKIPEGAPLFREKIKSIQFRDDYEKTVADFLAEASDTNEIFTAGEIMALAQKRGRVLLTDSAQVIDILRYLPDKLKPIGLGIDRLSKRKEQTGGGFREYGAYRLKYLES